MQPFNAPADVGEGRGSAQGNPPPLSPALSPSLSLSSFLSDLCPDLILPIPSFCLSVSWKKGIRRWINMEMKGGRGNNQSFWATAVN